MAEGTIPPKAEDRKLDRLEILPKNAILTKGATQQFLVRAHFHDGSSEDVTHWAKYQSASGDVAQIDDSGKVTIVGFGEGAITVWYLSKVAIGSVTVPYENQVSPKIFAEAPRRKFHR